MKFSVPVVVCFLFLGLIVAPFSTPDARAEGQVEVHALKVEGLVIGTKIKIDQEYAQKYNRPVKGPFEFIAPKTKGVRVFAAYPPETGGEFIKISFATEDKKLIENLRFTDLTVPMADQEKRLAMLEKLMVEKAAPMAVKGYAEAKLLGVRRARIKDLDAVEVAARFQAPQLGQMYVWLVGILNPDSEFGVLAMSQITSNSEVKQPGEIGKKGIAVKALSTFKFITD